MESVDRLTTEQAAEILGVHPKTLIRWRRLNQGPSFVRVGKKIFYRALTVQAYLEREQGGEITS